jgi:hypothetical protein
MAITGHKTRDVFERYNIVSAGDLEEAAKRIAERLSNNDKNNDSCPSVIRSKPLISLPVGR